jgi:thioredoxin 1
MGAGIVRLVTDASFSRNVLEAEGFVLLSFGASWCGPCRLLAPALRFLAASRKDSLTIAKLDVDASPGTPERYGVQTFPTCILFRAGEEVARFDGYMPLRKLETALQPYLDPD